MLIAHYLTQRNAAGQPWGRRQALGPGSLAELLLGLYASAPLDGCTYYGVDAGGAAVPVNLYLDILGACCTATSFDEY